jgi:hypothetical protein
VADSPVCLNQSTLAEICKGRLSTAENVPWEITDLNEVARKFAQKHAHVAMLQELTG